MTSKFKVGDKVVYVGSSNKEYSGHPELVGLQGTVDDFTTLYVDVVFPYEGGDCPKDIPWPCYEWELKIVQ